MSRHTRKGRSTGKSEAPAPLPPLDPLQRYSIEEALRYLRLSRKSLYREIAAGNLKTFEEQRRRFVPGTELQRLSMLPAQRPAQP